VYAVVLKDLTNVVYTVKPPIHLYNKVGYISTWRYSVAMLQTSGLRPNSS